MKSNVVSMLKKRFSQLWLPLLVGTGSLALAVVIGSTVLAQSNTPPMPPERHHNRLNLTAEQETQMQQIRETEREQIGNILTAEQRSQLEAARGNREELRQAFESLDLTDEQRTQIETVRRNSREQRDAILTAEQRQQVQQHRSRCAEDGPPPQ